MKKSNYAGVIADASRAIELLRQYYASHPNDHSTFILAQAYSQRGEAREATGDPARAIPDYENAVKNDRAPIYEEKLKDARAKVSKGAVKTGQAAADSFGSQEKEIEAAKAEYQSSSHDETARVHYVAKLADMSAQLTPKILHNPDVDAKVIYANQAGAIEQELRKHPMPRNADSRKLSQLLVGEWQSPRHTYVFRADGTYGVGDEQRDKWRIDGNEYIDDVSRGPIVLLDHNYFIYACGQGVIIYTRADSASSGNGDKPADLAIKQKLVGYWKFPKAVCYITADGKMYVGPRKNEMEKSRWDVRNGNFYWENVPYTIVSLADNKFVFREIGGQGETFMLNRSTKEEVDPE
jgi:tetratricopeptide (TPR) repeat protein